MNLNFFQFENQMFFFEIGIENNFWLLPFYICFINWSIN